jgi:osmotically-inducible protein OsmY
MPALKPANTATATPHSTPQLLIKDLAEGCLRRNPYRALKNVSCDYEAGVLTLRGCLPSYYLKQVAQQVVAHLEGVERIHNQIEVVTPASCSNQS